MAPLQTRAAVEVEGDDDLGPGPSPGMNGAPIDYSQLGGFTLICEECEALGEDFCHWSRRPHRLAGGTRPIALDAEFLEPIERLHAWRPGHTLLVAVALAGFTWVLAARWCLQRRRRGRQRQRQQQQQQQKADATPRSNDVALSLDRARQFKVGGCGSGGGGGGREHHPVGFPPRRRSRAWWGQPRRVRESTSERGQALSGGGRWGVAACTFDGRPFAYNKEIRGCKI